jgi:hypothetical protein
VYIALRACQSRRERRCATAPPIMPTRLRTRASVRLVGAGAVGARALKVPDHGRRIVSGDPQDMDVCGLTHLPTRTASPSRKRQDKAAPSPPLAPGMRPARLARRVSEHSSGARLCPDDRATQMAAAACPFLGRCCGQGRDCAGGPSEARSIEPLVWYRSRPETQLGAPSPQGGRLR